MSKVKNFGDQALLAAATNDVPNSRKQWRDNTIGGTNVTPQTASPA
jgi:hypothetical protein